MKKLIFIITIFALFTFSNKIDAQTPNLRSASNFALFTVKGAFGNNGAETTVTGDVGTQEGAFTAFPTGTLIGDIFVSDPTSAQAALDVVDAYNELEGNSCDEIISTNLGDEQILTAKVYCIEAATILNGNLILDGEGNSNSIFIFKIDGALIVNPLSNIVLINSASRFNVYWQINGLFDLGTNSTFQGTIIANGAISLFENSSLLGRGLSRAGAILLDKSLVNLSTTTLPIKLISFDVQLDNETVKIDWSTVSEMNNDFFTLEKSIDGIYFTEIEKISGAGNSNSQIYYSTFDLNPIVGTSFYRLKQTDFDGEFSISNVISIDYKKQFINEIKVFPNPFNQFLNVEISEIDNVEFSIFNLLGNEIIKTKITTQSTNFDTNKFKNGTYFYSISKNGKLLKSGKIISL
ncbi:MAG: hypothetical protein A2W98_03870 [Bacteroidetes bacterium GWF2_33_38]|nr:MAG: hypothetical protein A2W98_03870 [Bacteroidetes bacterium GWF2_33_38]OFY76193.1 MAG: hypothetical protein A2265_10695 [Bacteroidetes bacterium RIFOXYA12_FULL_33_9]